MFGKEGEFKCSFSGTYFLKENTCPWKERFVGKKRPTPSNTGKKKEVRQDQTSVGNQKRGRSIFGKGFSEVPFPKGIIKHLHWG